MRCVGVIGALLLACSCTASFDGERNARDGVPSGEAVDSFDSNPGDGEHSGAASFLSLARKADAVVIARLLQADFSEEEEDGFLTSSRWQVVETLRGRAAAGETLHVRFPLGREAGGNWRWIGGESAISPDAAMRMKPGDTFLLMLSREFYERQVRARSGRPIDGVTGAGFGLHRVGEGRILPGGSFEPPPTIEALKKILKEG